MEAVVGGFVEVFDVFRSAGEEAADAASEASRTVVPESGDGSKGGRRRESPVNVNVNLDGVLRDAAKLLSIGGKPTGKQRGAPATEAEVHEESASDEGDESGAGD